MTWGLRERSLGAFLIVTLLFASFFFLAAEGVRASAPTEQEPQPGDIDINMTEQEFRPVFFSMRSNYKLLPDPFLGNSSGLFVSCPADFVPAPWSKQGMFGSYQWVDIGTWTSKPTKSPVKIDTQSKLEYRLTIQNSGDLDLIAADFEMTVKIGGRTIGNPIAISGVDVDSKTVGVITGAANTNFNVSDIRIGETIAISLRCLVDVDGICILYDSGYSDSGIIINCKPIEIKEIKGCAQEVHVAFSDAFNLGWEILATKGYVKMIVDNAEVREDLVVQKDTSGNVLVTWKHGLLPGDNHLNAIITYRGNCSWMKANLQKLASSGYPAIGQILDPTQPMFFVFIGIVVAGIASAGIGYRRYKKGAPARAAKAAAANKAVRASKPGMPKGTSSDIAVSSSSSSPVSKPGMPKARPGMPKGSIEISTKGARIVRPGMPKSGY